jgi:hypothetical protein
MAVPNWEEILPPISAPSNYKDPKKIAAYIAERRDKLEQGEAAEGSLTGTVMRAVVITPGKKGDKVALDADEELTENGQPKVIHDTTGRLVSSEVLNGILAECGADTHPEALKNIVIIGCNIHRNLRLMALDYIAVEEALPFSLHWAVDFDPNFKYNRVPGFVDPVSILFGSSSTDPVAAGKRFGIPVDPSDAQSMALLAFHLAKRLGM